jgi:hypothetical protein
MPLFFGRCRRPKRFHKCTRDNNNAAQTPGDSKESARDRDDNVTCRRDAPTFRDIFRDVHFEIFQFCLFVSSFSFLFIDSSFKFSFVDPFRGNCASHTGRLEQHALAPTFIAEVASRLWAVNLRPIILSFPFFLLSRIVSSAEDEFFGDSVDDRRAGGCAARRKKAIFESEVIGIRDHPGERISDPICATVRRCRDLVSTKGIW